MSKNLMDDKELIGRVLDKLDKVDGKLDKIEERLSEAEKIAIKQESNLALHMKRSDLLEASQNNLEEAVKPILKVYTIAWGLCKLFGGISMVIGVFIGLYKIYKLVM